MNARYLLGLALVTAGVVAACGGSPDQGSLNPGGDNGTGTVPNAPSQGTKNPDGTVTPNPTPAPNPGGPAVPGNLPTNSKAGKAFFAASVQPILESKCATCHVAGGPGNPTYIVKGDPTNEVILRRARVHRAHSIVVLMDDRQGDHADGKTILTCIAIQGVCKGDQKPNISVECRSPQWSIIVMNTRPSQLQ